VSDWAEHVEREVDRFRDGEARLPDPSDPDARQKQLTRMGNAAGGAGLALLMQGNHDEASEWLHRAAETYRESLADAPAGSWGRPIGAMKALVVRAAYAGKAAIGFVGGVASERRSDDWPAAEEAATWTLEYGAADTGSPIGHYAAALALLILGRDHEAIAHADAIRTRDDFPNDVGDALAFIAAQDLVGYTYAIESVLESFETRDEYLEDIPVADTVLVLQALAARRGLAAELSSPLLP
jgi:hypothetical protein